MPVKFQQEFICQIDKEEAEKLLKIDWDEMATKARGEEFEINWQGYEALEELGMLKVFSCRDDGNLVGYFSVVVTKSMTSKNTINAVSEAFYLHPDYRKGMTGVKLFKFVEKCLKEDGYDNFVVTSTEHYPLDKFLTRLGFDKAETLYHKEL